jgi:hypothetical protein
MRKFSDRNQRTKEINGLYQTWSHCQKQKGIKRNKFFSDFVFFLFSGKRHFLLRQLAERDDVTRFRCLKISEKIWLIYLFFAYLQRCWGCAFSPLQFWFFPRNEKHTQRRNKKLMFV